MGIAALTAAFTSKPQICCPLALTGTSKVGTWTWGGPEPPRQPPALSHGSSPSAPSLPYHGGSRCPLPPAPHCAPTLALFLPPNPREGGGAGGAQLVQAHPPPTFWHSPGGAGRCRGQLPSPARGRGGSPMAGAVNVGQALIFSGAGGAAPGWWHSCLLRWNASCSLRGWPPPLPDPHGPHSPRAPPACPQEQGACSRWGAQPWAQVLAPGMWEVQNVAVAKPQLLEATGHM